MQWSLVCMAPVCGQLRPIYYTPAQAGEMDWGIGTLNGGVVVFSLSSTPMQLAQDHAFCIHVVGRVTSLARIYDSTLWLCFYGCAKGRAWARWLFSKEVLVGF